MLKSNLIKASVITNLDDLTPILDIWNKNIPMVLDVETYGIDPNNGKLLGISLCSITSPECPIYVCLQWYDHRTSTWYTNPNLEAFKSILKPFLSQAKLIGHNYAYDKH